MRSPESSSWVVAETYARKIDGLPDVARAASVDGLNREVTARTEDKPGPGAIEPLERIG